jgi:nucleotide-binding universal stress UspA family protein
MSTFRRILYVSERAADGTAALRRAAALAESHQAQLTLLEVIPPMRSLEGLYPAAPSRETLTETLAARRHAALETLAAPLRPRLDVRVEILSGTPFLEVVRAVLRSDYDLVVKAAENPDWLRRLFGSQDMHLLRKCPCPVWLTRPGERERYERIVAAVDFDPLHEAALENSLNERILALAAGIALAELASLHVVHAWQAPEADFVELFTDRPDAVGGAIADAEYLRRQQAMAGLRAALGERHGPEGERYLDAQFHLPQGPARTEIPAMVERVGADLLVMGTIARTGIPGFLIGNTAEAILDQLTCSVLAVKPPGFESPVGME